MKEKIELLIDHVFFNKNGELVVFATLIRGSSVKVGDVFTEKYFYNMDDIKKMVPIGKRIKNNLTKIELKVQKITLREDHEINELHRGWSAGFHFSGNDLEKLENWNVISTDYS